MAAVRLCACGCGLPTNPLRRRMFRHGHHWRVKTKEEKRQSAVKALETRRARGYRMNGAVAYAT